MEFPSTTLFLLVQTKISAAWPRLHKLPCSDEKGLKIICCDWFVHPYIDKTLVHFKNKKDVLLCLFSLSCISVKWKLMNHKAVCLQMTLKVVSICGVCPSLESWLWGFSFQFCNFSLRSFLTFFSGSFVIDRLRKQCDSWR